MSSFLGEVMGVVAQAHSQDVDKSGSAYFLHCIEVMRGAKHQGIVCEVELAVAVAHDIGEDHPEYLPALYEITDRYCVTDKFRTGLDLLTRKSTETYQEFIHRICVCNLLWVVKIKKADLKHNSRIDRLKGVTDNDIARMKKYHRSWLELTKAETGTID